MLKNKSATVYTISGKEIRADLPEPIISDIDLVPFKHRQDPQNAVDALIEGYSVLITDFYSSGLAVLNELKKLLKRKHSDQSFQAQRDFRSEFRKLSHRLLVVVNKHELAVKKAPKIGWFKILYPELQEFLLPFPQVQGLNSSWQWYEKGISIPGLPQKIHPFFGTYFPTRFDHLTLFDSWLKDYKGKKKSAVDIGIGSGILSFQMLQHGFEKVFGTDSNPNAIIGLSEALDKNPIYSKIELSFGHLFADFTIKTELIVFNPPWLPALYNTKGLDKAIYYDENLFPQFFAEVINHLKPEGRVVLLFSNLAQIIKVSKSHPIRSELATGGRFQKELFIQTTVKPASEHTRRNQKRRSDEIVELWVLKLIH